MFRCKLAKLSPNETKVVQSYIGRFEHNPAIESVMIVWNSEVKRNENQWEYLAIKFKDSLSQAGLIQAIVKVRADDYLGVNQDGYHIFWFD